MSSHARCGSLGSCFESHFKGECKTICANGRPGSDGSFCPYLEHEPLTEDGWIAWDILLRSSRQLRLAPLGYGVIGLDFTAVMSLGAAIGAELAVLAELLPAGEAGLVSALNERLSDT